MQSDNLVSVVVPIYNTDLGILAQCLDSLAAQTYSNLEILLIDDGSDRKSGVSELCRNVEAQDKRFRYIYKENGGVSSARNIGIEQSHGKYIAFCDSDDLIEPRAYQFLVESLETNETSQIALMGYDRKNACSGVEAVSARLTTSAEIISRYLSLKDDNLCASCSTSLMRRKMLIEKNVCFDESISISEDFLFMYEILASCESVIYLEANLYHYREIGNSATHSYVQDLDRQNAYRIRRLCEIKPMEQKRLDIHVGLWTIVEIKNICRNSSPYTFFERRRYARERCRSHKSQLKLLSSKDTAGFSFRVQARLLLAAPTVYVCLRSVWNRFAS